MRKFKHKILNCVAELQDRKYKVVVDNILNIIPQWVVENSNDWQEIKEFPKIISFRGDGDNIATLNEYGTYTYNSNGRDFTKEHLLNVKLVTIHQVATSPTDVWTVGDRVNYKRTCNYDSFIIDNFFMRHDKIMACSHKGLEVIFKFVEDLIKAPQPILTTEDNAEVFKGDRVYNLNTQDWTYNCVEIYEDCKPRLNYKFFKYLTNLEKCIMENKPRFSVKDIEDLTKALKKQSFVYWDEIIKQKLGI